MIIISKCPYRISLLGGSSDLDWFVERYGEGLSVGFSIQAYSTIVLKYRNINQKGILNYSSREEYTSIENITHPIIRECLNFFSIKNPIEMSSFGENINGSGLGSSSSFTVALINALAELNNRKLSQSEAANLASEIEIRFLKNQIGRQDQYLCSLGGVNILKFNKDKSVKRVKKIKISEAISSIANNLYLVNTGITRSASETLKKIKNDKNSFKSIVEILEIAKNFIDNTEHFDKEKIVNFLLESLKKSWKIKREITGVMNENLFSIESKLRELDFEVLKLLGAGGGGYFLIRYIGESEEEGLKKLNQNNLNYQKVLIDNFGSKTWQV